MATERTTTNKRLVTLELSSAQLKEIEAATGTPIKGIAIDQIIDSSELNKIDRGLVSATKAVVSW